MLSRCESRGIGPAQLMQSGKQMGLGVHFHVGRIGLVEGKPMVQGVLFEGRKVSQASRLGQRLE